MIDADALATNRRQVISSHYADSIMATVLREPYHKCHVTTTKQTMAERGREVGNPLGSL